MAKQRTKQKPLPQFLGNKPWSHRLQTQLVDWFQHNQRDLPWRKNRDPYAIWISEVMLQQTTSQAVIPYFNRFLERFPTVQSLAQAPEGDVLKHWAGLGYYSRARNLHKASQKLHEIGFPRTAAELLELPGFGPYTSRAVSSIAFDESVGVLDGNVIRILSRVTGTSWKWWMTADRTLLQQLADQLVQDGESSQVNPAMMELGATVCTPQSPSCFLCPWREDCVGRREGLLTDLPLKKPKADSHILLWDVEIFQQQKKIGFIQNNYAPFLKQSRILPGTIKTLSERPARFDLKHTITKYEIFTRIRKGKTPPAKVALTWLDIRKITEEIPYSLITKTLRQAGVLDEGRSLRPQRKSKA